VAGFLLRVAREIRHAEPDVLHAYLGGANIVAMALKPLLPRTKVALGVRSSETHWADYTTLARTSFLMEGLASRRADLIVCNSGPGAKLYAGRGPAAERITVIPNGIDTSEFRPRPEERRRLRAEWGVGEGDVLVGVVARLDPAKRHANVLRAVAELRGRGHPVRLVCIGGGGPDEAGSAQRGDYSAQIGELVRSLGLGGFVCWQRDREDVALCYSAMDVYVCASVTEGFPNAVAEAMACGVPCVVTDVGDCRLLVGDAGVVVPPESPEALTVGMDALLARVQRERGLGHEARARIVSEFSVARLVARTDRALRELLGGDGDALRGGRQAEPVEGGAQSNAVE
jgi:glycosyltransferase involved in cell wall biosynthesis